jgi:hypothetical protein
MLGDITAVCFLAAQDGRTFSRADRVRLGGP